MRHLLYKLFSSAHTEILLLCQSTALCPGVTVTCRLRTSLFNRLSTNDHNAHCLVHASHLRFSRRSTSEVSGIGMESSLLRFARQHFQAAVAFPMLAGTSLLLQANAAAMVPWGAAWQQKPTCISDRSALWLRPTGCDAKQHLLHVQQYTALTEC